MLTPGASRRGHDWVNLSPNWESFYLMSETHQFKVMKIYLFFSLLPCLQPFYIKLIFLLQQTIQTQCEAIQRLCSTSKVTGTSTLSKLIGMSSFVGLHCFDLGWITGQVRISMDEIWELVAVRRNFGKVFLYKPC